MKTEKANDRYDENQSKQKRGLYISDEELQFYKGTGFFTEEEDLQDFLSVRKAQSLDNARPLNLNLMILILLN